ncbi:hypothetical protein AAG570_012152 [Ranatra chinensis]|uniref:Uncharacterized protein n=1 Tax=Ranatra chinensis TaxID=642074 RepID=A0ABD0YI94_9HEMI
MASKRRNPVQKNRMQETICLPFPVNRSGRAKRHKKGRIPNKDQIPDLRRVWRKGATPPPRDSLSSLVHSSLVRTTFGQLPSSEAQLEKSPEGSTTPLTRGSDVILTEITSPDRNRLKELGEVSPLSPDLTVLYRIPVLTPLQIVLARIVPPNGPQFESFSSGNNSSIPLRLQRLSQLDQYFLGRSEFRCVLPRLSPFPNSHLLASYNSSPI